MKVFTRTLLVLALCQSAALGLETKDASENDDARCGLYLAPSSKVLKEGEGTTPPWSIYVGHQPLQTGQVIGSPDVAINLHNFGAHNEIESDSQNAVYVQYMAQVANVLSKNLWVPEMAGAMNELPINEESNVFIPGSGMLSGWDVTLQNADFDVLASHVRFPHDARVAHQGAQTHLNKIVLRATHYIEAGSEILMNYDAADDFASLEWDDDDDDETSLTDSDFVKVDTTVDKLLEFFDKHKETFDKSPSARMQIYQFMTQDFLEAAVGEIKSRKIQTVVPNTPEELILLKIAGGSKQFNASRAHLPRQKSMEWLEAHGLCMDHVRSDVSELAGRGAFANRNIAKGSLVVPVPLLTVPDVSILNMYELEIDEEDGLMERANDIPIGKQLLYNYMYGHVNSTLAFVPLGAQANLINHSNEPNAKMEWSKHYMSHPELFGVKPHELLKYRDISLTMEITALRDISKDEEITINYGADWTKAWDAHVEKIQKKVSSGESKATLPILAADMNKELLMNPVRTIEEQKHNPYPENVALQVFGMHENDYSNLGETKETATYVFDEPDLLTDYSANFLVRPLVLERNDSNSTYVYTIQYKDVEGTFVTMNGVPHEAFVFLDEPGTSYQFVENPFRHFIQIPDDIFPEKWKNVVTK
jgi:hypothetical protein